MAGHISAITITDTDKNKCFPTITEYTADIKLNANTKIIISFVMGIEIFSEIGLKNKIINPISRPNVNTTT